MLRLVEHPPILHWAKQVTPEERKLFLKYEASQAIIWHSSGAIRLSEEDFLEAASRCPATCVGNSTIMRALGELNPGLRNHCILKAPYHSLSQASAIPFINKKGTPTLEDLVTRLSISEIRTAQSYVVDQIISVIQQTSNTRWLLKINEASESFDPKLRTSIQEAIALRI